MKPLVRIARDVMVVLAVAFVLAGVIIHIAIHPEWTQPQALRGLWPLWLSGTVLALGSVLIDLWMTARGWTK